MRTIQLADLTLEEKIGQMFVCGWQGAAPAESRTLNAHAAMLLDELRAGGVILMGRNVGPPAETAALCNALQERSRVPLLVATDQEGGAVCRFVEPGLTFPGNMALGAAGSEALVEQVATAIGTQLRAMGLNVDFAPDLDVNSNPANPVIGIRSFGESPEEVARLGAAALRGFEGAGVIAAVKHFPGHGDTAVDSHFDLPVQPARRERLEAVELLPFRAAVAAGVPMVMTTHIVFPALDPERPATLSRPIMTGLLREEMGFEGLIVTDCLEMKAIADRWGMAEVAVLAVEAGVDLLLACHTERVQRALRDALLAAVTAGRIPEPRIDESVERILAAKRAFGIMEGSAADPARAREVVGAPEYRALEAEAARAGIAALGSTEGLLPLPSGAAATVLGERGPAQRLARALQERGLRAEVRSAAEDAGADAVVILADDPAGLAISQARRQSLQACRIVVALTDPYALARFPDAPLRLATFGEQECQLAALADALTGAFTPTGRMPVTI